MEHTKLRERIELVRAMETVARSVNDENIFDSIWLPNGVADGDIDENTQDEDLECYCEDDDDFAELMATFLTLMHNATLFGGLYCGGVVSNDVEVIE